MIVYTVNQRGAEYHDDGNHYEAQGEAAIKAYSTRQAAQRECDRLNARSSFRKDGDSILQLPKDYCTSKGNRVDEFTVGELEVLDPPPIPKEEIRKNLHARLDKLREEHKGVVEDAFREVFCGLFKEHPDLKQFAWRQYTPYFNDGDVCTFSVNTYDPRINDEEWFEGTSDLCGPVRKALENFRDEDYLAAFGDHVEVQVLRVGDGCIISTKECDHD